MRIAVLGRTGMLLRAAQRLAEAPHRIAYVATAKASEFYDVGDADYERFAHSLGVSYYCGARLDSDDVVATLRASQSDVAISMNWPTILSERVRACFPLGIFNAHPGDLPRYRGNACPNWAILQGEPRIALCIHRMSDALDDGPVAIRHYLPLTDEQDIGTVYDWLHEAVPEAFVSLIRNLAAGTVSLAAQSNDPEDALRCYPRRPEDSRIDWRESSGSIHRLVRASTRPMLGAYSHLEGQHLVRVWKARRWESRTPFLGVPGQVAGQVDGDPLILTGDGMLRLIEAQFDDGAVDAKPVILSSLRNRLV